MISFAETENIFSPQIGSTEGPTQFLQMGEPFNILALLAYLLIPTIFEMFSIQYLFTLNEARVPKSMHFISQEPTRETYVIIEQPEAIILLDCFFLKMQ